MPLTPERKRLNELLEDQRIKLRLTWVEVANRAEISVESIHAIRRGQGASIRDLTQDALERALQLPSGTIKRILEGEVLDLDMLEVVEQVSDEDVAALVTELQEQNVQIDALTEDDLRLVAAYAKALADRRNTDGNGDDTNRRVS